ncbi:MAG: ABC-F family ATP-binding cassette domain-containing protein [Chthonomonadales bacterium]|nr:ABC-F family ATP-binding cassette domain-containing protein [Chthonomonadales bacterium]
MLIVRGIEKRYGARAILDRVGLAIGDGDRVGLVGRNGCGKTTLLRVLAGVEAPDRAGAIAVARGVSVGYLPQVAVCDRNETAAEHVAAASGAQAWEARRALRGLGLGATQLDQPAAALSGGEKTRMLLAALLLGRHDLLLLDEPTSHLDVAGIAWLEEHLRGRRGTFLVASHDRRFLDATVRRILELDDGGLTEYAGGYTAYREAREQALVRRREDAVLRDRQVRALREFASRQRAWAARAQDGPKRGRDQRGRIAAKMARRARGAESRAERLMPVEVALGAHSLSAAFAPRKRGGQIVLEARGLGHAYGERWLFRGVDLSVGRGERIGVIGPNGAGKSTLLRLLLGQEAPCEGVARAGEGIEPFLLDQEQSALDDAGTVLDAVQAMGALSATEARTLLACFLFRDQDVFKRIGDLSGGERVRAAIAGAVVSGANLLVLDEPTDRLDLHTRERLEDALDAHPGTLVVVSHDRYLLDRLTSRTLVVGGGRLEDYPGPFSEWAARRAPGAPDMPGTD